ncbi:MAG TPA: helix-turn-helix domain-containing protein [Thermobifida alba]|nr:helix-turn-helix domain-containing protein [Thermobifida alba]
MNGSNLGERMVAVSFGDVMRRLMAERGVSLRALARQVPCNAGYLSKVSRDLKRPSEDVAARLDDILGAGGALLAAHAPAPVPDSDPDAARLLYVERHPMRIDAVVVDGLAATLASQRRLEDVVGSAAVVEAAAAHLGIVLRLLRDARGPQARRLAAVASEASQFNGWLNTSIGAHDKAGPLYDQALRLGMQAGDEDLAATALSMRGHLAWAIGEYGTMAGLSEAAAGMAAAVGTRTVATQQHGRALALLGEREAALRAIGEAEEMFACGQGGQDDPDGLYFYGAELLTMQRGLILAYLGEHQVAADVIDTGLARLPEAIRDSGWIAWYRAHGARARAAAGEVDAAAAALLKTLPVVDATGSVKARAEIVSAWRQMARRWPGRSCVVELGEALRRR